jgi:hypothetical protein
MGVKIKPFVVINDGKLAQPIADETLQLEREALLPDEYKRVQDARTPEEAFRTEVAIAQQQKYPFLQRYGVTPLAPGPSGIPGSTGGAERY